jgi:diguanylate cyclase (GGDEF)-like protein
MEITRVLLVEDSDTHGFLMGDALRRVWPDLTVDQARTGERCLELLAEHTYNAIVLDYNLPGSSGLDLLAKIKQAGIAAPVLMVTGQGDESIAVAAMKAGVQDYLVKTRDYYAAIPQAVSKAVEVARIKGRLEQNEIRQRKLNELALDLATDLDPDSVLQRLVQSARMLLRCDAALVQLSDPASGRIIAFAADGLEFDQPPTETRGGLPALLASLEAPIAIQDFKDDERFLGTPTLQPVIGSALLLPFPKTGPVRKALFLGNRDGGAKFNEDDFAVVQSLVILANTALENARLHLETQRLAITDGLTGLFNHLEFKRRLESECERAQRYGREFSLLMLDVDHFKQHNDRYGHPAGDAVLRGISDLLRQVLRGVDVVARYGGEEFAAILPETPSRGGVALAERVREAVMKHTFRAPDGAATPVTVSIGIATAPMDGKSANEVLVAADQALYVAKETGRNRVYRFSTENRVVESLPNPEAGVPAEPSEHSLLVDLSAALDARSPYLRGQSARSTRYAMAFGRVLRLAAPQIEALRLASMLHNVGTMNVPDSVLNKPGPLNDEERKIIQAHPVLAGMLFKQIRDLDDVLPAILYHHERWDGHGYPNGLKEDEIPLLARVLAIVAAHTAMAAPRPHRERLTRDEIARELRANAGTQFDPKLVEQFIDWVKQIDSVK